MSTTFPNQQRYRTIQGHLATSIITSGTIQYSGEIKQRPQSAEYYRTEGVNGRIVSATCKQNLPSAWIGIRIFLHSAVFPFHWWLVVFGGTFVVFFLFRLHRKQNNEQLLISLFLSSFVSMHDSGLGYLSLILVARNYYYYYRKSVFSVKLLPSPAAPPLYD